jgi:hypothetical protein
MDRTFLYAKAVVLFEATFHTLNVQGPHLRTPKPGFNPGFTPRICYIKGGRGNPGLNTGFGVLRCGLSTIRVQVSRERTRGGAVSLSRVAARGADWILTELAPPPLSTHHLTTAAAVVLTIALQIKNIYSAPVLRIRHVLSRIRIRTFSHPCF